MLLCCNKVYKHAWKFLQLANREWGVCLPRLPTLFWSLNYLFFFLPRDSLVATSFSSFNYTVDNQLRIYLIHPPKKLPVATTIVQGWLVVSQVVVSRSGTFFIIYLIRRLQAGVMNLGNFLFHGNPTPAKLSHKLPISFVVSHHIKFSLEFNNKLGESSIICRKYNFLQLDTLATTTIMYAFSRIQIVSGKCGLPETSYHWYNFTHRQEALTYYIH